MSINLKVAQLIYAIRVTNKKTQTRVAQIMGCTFQQVQKYEKLINKISITKLEKFCNFFDITLSNFFNMEPYSIIETSKLSDSQKINLGSKIQELEMLDKLERSANDKGGSNKDMVGESVSERTHI
jgi:transcriptional regulator with XRE-family HTH domain